MNSSQKGFAVRPKLDCPHLKSQRIEELIEFFTKVNNKHFSEFACEQCSDQSQNWVCVECKQICCSRYVNTHMVNHNASTQHPIALSFSDGSFWCYECDSYIDHPCLMKARKQFSASKFSLGKEQDVNKLLENLKINEKQSEEVEKVKFSFEDLVSGLKNRKFKKVVFLTGAGLSVAAGIPDFRTPGTGLYSQLEKYKLPRPESIFQLEYFRKNPQPFMKLAKEFFISNCKPTLGHKFIKKIQDEGILLKCMTQNIDGLQIDAGMDAKNLLQAHGHSRTAHCIDCQTEAKIESWKQNLEEQKPLYCSKQECKGLVKPDIVFFGEQLPKQFHAAPKIMQESDLVIVIGSSLAVMPFAFLAQMVPSTCPVVLINNTDSLPQIKERKLWMQGDIQDNIAKISKQLEWEL